MYKLPPFPAAESAEAHTHAIIHIDVDAFYAQVEMVLNPSLREKPVAVQQKTLLITCNYVARAQGVPKGSSIQQALAACPGLVIINGENIERYRRANAGVYSYLENTKLASHIQTLNLDEFWLDVTSEVAKRHAHTDTQTTRNDKMDTSGSVLEGGHTRGDEGGAVGEQFPDFSGHVRASAAADAPPTRCACGCEERLAIASHIAAEIRAGILKSTGLFCTAGVSTSKMLSKLAASLHRPNDQTTLLPICAESFVAQLPIRSLPGCGRKSTQALTDAVRKAENRDESDTEKVTVSEVRKLGWDPMTSLLGVNTATQLWPLVCGVDMSPVISSTRPKAISEEDSYKRGLLTTVPQLKVQLKILLTTIMERIESRRNSFGESPTSIVLSLRLRDKDGNYGNRHSRQCAYPSILLPRGGPGSLEKAIEGGYNLLLQLWDRHSVASPFDISHLGVGFASFTSSTNSANTHAGGNMYAYISGNSPGTEERSPPGTEKSSSGTEKRGGVAGFDTGGMGPPVSKKPRTISEEHSSERSSSVGCTTVTVSEGSLDQCNYCGVRVLKRDIFGHHTWHQTTGR